MDIITNPITKKRFQRFRSMKRAYLSFWILVILYVLSLGSELICNNVPLYVRCNGHSYFPVFFYYSENTFLHDGQQTRPDYKVLEKDPVFSKHTDNFMIFPPFPYGPYESIDPKSIPVSNTVTLELTPVPRIAIADIRQNFSVVRDQSLDFFVAGHHDDLTGIHFNRYFVLPEALKADIMRRFANRASPYTTFTVRSVSGQTVEIGLSTYRPRSHPPQTVQLILREMPSKTEKTVGIEFSPKMQPVYGLPGIWRHIPKDDRAVLKNFVAQRFTAPVDNYRVVIDGRSYIASFHKADVRFPFPPVKGHPLGIDAAGRDVLARILYGLRISLTFGLLLVIGAMGIGIAAGAVQGYYGGKLDITAQRMVEVWSALPFLYIMILMGSIYGRSFMLLLVCYGLFNWIGISYYVRAEFLRLRKQPFVEAATCMGVPGRKIIFKHILPNALVPVVTFFPFSLVGAIGSLAALDYLGFGLPPPTPSWGEMLFEAQQYRWAWWLILYPALALFTVMLLGVFVGEGVRNAYDPKKYTRLE